MITKGKNVIIKENVILGENVVLEDNVYVDSGAIIRDNVHIGENTYIGSQCILGEYQSDFFCHKKNGVHPLTVGKNSVIRSEVIIYGDTTIGDDFQTGHRATIRENCNLGHHVRVGTLTDIQHSCKIGDYVSMHSNVFLGEETVIDNYVWLFPGVTITNDPAPPSNTIQGVHVKEYAVIAARSLILPGIVIGKNSLVGAGSIVTKEVETGNIVIGNPGRVYGSIWDLDKKSKKNRQWQLHFERGMPWEKIGYGKWVASIRSKTDN